MAACARYSSRTVHREIRLPNTLVSSATSGRSSGATAACRRLPAKTYGFKAWIATRAAVRLTNSVMQLRDKVLQEDADSVFLQQGEVGNNLEQSNLIASRNRRSTVSPAQRTGKDSGARTDCRVEYYYPRSQNPRTKGRLGWKIRWRFQHSMAGSTRYGEKAGIPQEGRNSQNIFGTGVPW